MVVLQRPVRPILPSCGAVVLWCCQCSDWWQLIFQCARVPSTSRSALAETRPRLLHRHWPLIRGPVGEVFQGRAGSFCMGTPRPSRTQLAHGTCRVPVTRLTWHRSRRSFELLLPPLLHHHRQRSSRRRYDRALQLVDTAPVSRSMCLESSIGAGIGAASAEANGSDKTVNLACWQGARYPKELVGALARRLQTVAHRSGASANHVGPPSDGT